MYKLGSSVGYLSANQSLPSVGADHQYYRNDIARIEMRPLKLNPVKICFKSKILYCTATVV